MTALDEDSRHIVRTIAQSAQRGRNLVKQVLSFARGLEGARVTVRIPELLEEVATIVGKSTPSTVNIAIEIAPGLRTVLGEPTQLQQIFLNLFVNAAEAMSRGGRIQVAAQNVDLDDHYAAMRGDVIAGGFVKISVTDTGVGMAHEVCDRIFEPFFTTKPPGKGTGLGLSTALAVVRAHGGFIDVTSAPGAGTRFDVFLPARDGDVQAAADALSAPPRGQGQRVLLVDDEEPILDVTSRTLLVNGYNVVTATDGASAVAEFVKNPEIAVVVTDMVMPIMDGMALATALRRLNQKVKIICASGHYGGRRPRPEEGIFDFLQKPYSAVDLLESLHRATT